MYIILYVTHVILPLLFDPVILIYVINAVTCLCKPSQSIHSNNIVLFMKGYVIEQYIIYTCSIILCYGNNV